MGVNNPDLWPKVRDCLIDVITHFKHKPNVPYYLLAGLSSGKTCIARELAFDGGYKTVFAMDVNISMVQSSYGEFPKEHCLSPNQFEKGARAKTPKDVLTLMPTDHPALLIVENYQWMTNIEPVDAVIDFALSENYHVLILSSQGPNDSGKYFPTARLSSWDLNPDRNYTEIRRNMSPKEFERDFGGGSPYRGD